MILNGNDTIVALQESHKKQDVVARTPDKSKTRKTSQKQPHRDRLPPHPLAPLTSTSRTPAVGVAVPELLSLPLGEGEAQAEEVEVRGIRPPLAGALAPHVGVGGAGTSAGDAGGAGTSAGEIITHTSSTVSLFPPLPFPLLGVVLKTVALPIGLGFIFIFWPYPLAKEEGASAEGKCMCMCRRTPAGRANANVFGNGDTTPGERCACAWAECTWSAWRRAWRRTNRSAAHIVRVVVGTAAAAVLVSGQSKEKRGHRGNGMQEGKGAPPPTATAMCAGGVPACVPP
jgi:hypothetical protein